MTANDVCGECDRDLNGTAYLTDWTNRTNNLIANVTSTMSNVYINLISTLNLSDIARIQKTTPYCKFLHEKVLKECGCIDRGNQTQLEMMDHNVHTMNT